MSIANCARSRFSQNKSLTWLQYKKKYYTGNGLKKYSCKLKIPLPVPKAPGTRKMRPESAPKSFCSRAVSGTFEKRTSGHGSHNIEPDQAI